MFKAIKRWTHQIRYGSYEERRKWFFIIVVLVFCVIIGGWTIYALNSNGYKRPEGDPSRQGSLEEFWSVIKNATQSFKSQTSEAIDDMKLLIQEEQEKFETIQEDEKHEYGEPDIIYGQKEE